MNCSSSNGRVDILGTNTASLFAMSDRLPMKSEFTAFRDAMTGNWYDTALSVAFFSAANMRILQNGIRAGVYQKSNQQYIVENQDGDELKIIMRSIFLQNAKNLDINIPGQISALNKLVLDFSVPQVFGEANGYIKYKQDASTLVVPIDLPMLSYTNDKQLELKPWF
jgi:hypothetical protein